MSLKDITNTTVAVQKGITKKKRLSDGSFKTYHYSQSRKQFEIIFSDDSEKLQFENKLSHFKKCHGIKSMKEVFEIMFNDPLPSANQKGDSNIDSNYDGILGNSKSSTFLCENKQLFDLVDSVCRHQRNCQMDLLPSSLNHCGHVVDVKWNCHNGHSLHWQSSSVLGQNYTINYRVMMAYLCSGMNQIAYERFSEFADIGILSEYFRTKSSTQFSAIISVIARESVQFALFDEVQMAKDKGESGITIMRDARHHCRKNSYHTDHVTIGQHSHKVVNIQHINKIQEPSTQKHEKIGCEQMYADFEKQGISVYIHSHDRNLSVNKTIRTKDNVRNCNERWHAAKPVTRGIKLISSGARKNLGVTWHPELADKGARVRNHVYYAMDNCGGDPHVLQKLIDNCIPHFQNDHTNCPLDSECKTPNYLPDYIILRDATAIRLLTQFLHTLTLYKNASDYALCKDTYYVESFNNSVLVYLDKRIHYKDKSYMIRSNLAVLSWNEHVDRPFTSRWNPEEVHHNRRHLGKKAYKKKSFSFVNDIWVLLIEVINGREQNLPDLNLDNEGDDDHYEEDIDGG